MTKANEEDKKIGANIELQRKLKSKSRHWLGEKLGISYQQVQNYEIGKHRVSASRLFRIAAVLKIDVAIFFPSER